MENNIEDIPKSEPIEIPKKKTENIQEYMKNYKQVNKEKLNEKAREKHVCEICGGKYTTSGKYLHLRTKKILKIKIYSNIIMEEFDFICNDNEKEKESYEKLLTKYKEIHKKYVDLKKENYNLKREIKKSEYLKVRNRYLNNLVEDMKIINVAKKL
eukprot:gene3343-5890_t